MKKILIPITALLIAGCETQECAECVQTITTRWFTPNSVIKSEVDEVITIICDEQQVESTDGRFLMTEESFGNKGYYKQITKSTTCTWEN